MKQVNMNKKSKDEHVRQPTSKGYRSIYQIALIKALAIWMNLDENAREHMSCRDASPHIPRTYPLLSSLQRIHKSRDVSCIL